MQGIIVGVDGSENAASALRFAVREGELRDVSVTAVMAWGFLNQHHAVIGPEFQAHYDDDAALTALRTYVHEALPESKFDSVALMAVNEAPMAALMKQSRFAEMLVVGTRGRGSVRSLLLGSISSQCAQHAKCPVVVVNPEWMPPGYGESDHLVVGVDGSGSAAVALEWAVEETKVHHGRLEIVNAWQVPNAAGYPYVGVSFDPAPFERASEELLVEASAHSGADKLEPGPTLTNCNNRAGEALLEHSKKADMLVVGARGEGGFADLMLGSVARQVLHGAQCPVAVIPSER